MLDVLQPAHIGDPSPLPKIDWTRPAIRITKVNRVDQRPVTEERRPVSVRSVRDRVVQIVLIGSRNQLSAKEHEPFDPLLSGSFPEQTGIRRSSGGLIDRVVVPIHADHEGNPCETGQEPPENPQVVRVANADNTDALPPCQPGEGDEQPPLRHSEVKHR